MSLKAEYTKLMKKYKELPQYEDLDKEYALYGIDYEETYKNHILTLIRRKIWDKVAYFCRILEAVLYPSPNSAALMHESNTFTKEQKEEFSELYKKLMILEREGMLLNLGAPNDQEAKYIVSTNKKLIKYKKTIISLTKDLIKVWKSETKKEEGEHYFG